MAIRTITETIYTGPPVFGPKTLERVRLEALLLAAIEAARAKMSTWRNGRP